MVSCSNMFAGLGRFPTLTSARKTTSHYVPSATPHLAAFAGRFRQTHYPRESKLRHHRFARVLCTRGWTNPPQRGGLACCEHDSIIDRKHLGSRAESRDRSVSRRRVGNAYASPTNLAHRS